MFAVASSHRRMWLLNQQSRFQTAFLPPAPRAEPSGAWNPTTSPVAAEHLPDKMSPPFSCPTRFAIRRKTRGDALMQRAERRFETGKRYYQVQRIRTTRGANSTPPWI